MAVQAQYPSLNTTTFFNDLLSRGSYHFDNWSPTTTSAERPLSNPNLVRAPHAAIQPPPVTNNKHAVMVEIESLFKCNSATPAKRARGDADEVLFVKKPSVTMEVPRLNSSSTSMLSTSGRENPFIFEELQSQMSKQRQDVEQLLEIQGMQLKQALEESKMRHTREMQTMIEQALGSRLKWAGNELEKSVRKNMELEEKARQLSVEAQLWQNLANNNELMAFNLRHSLDLAVAQVQHEHMSKEGCGESQVDDVQSCCYGASAAADPSKDVKCNQQHYYTADEPRRCRVCNVKEVSILLLPCRHLCLCKECEGALEVCPLCRSPKNASVQVYMH